jgi:hypothetical protein
MSSKCGPYDYKGKGKGTKDKGGSKGSKGSKDSKGDMTTIEDTDQQEREQQLQQMQQMQQQQQLQQQQLDKQQQKQQTLGKVVEQMLQKQQSLVRVVEQLVQQQQRDQPPEQPQSNLTGSVLVQQYELHKRIAILEPQVVMLTGQIKWTLEQLDRTVPLPMVVSDETA